MQGSELGCDQVDRVGHMTEACFRSNRELIGIIEPRIVEVALPVHFQICNECVPVRYRAPAGPCVQVHACQSESRWNEYGRGFTVRAERLAVECQFGVEVTWPPV